MKVVEEISSEREKARSQNSILIFGIAQVSNSMYICSSFSKINISTAFEKASAHKMML